MGTGRTVWTAALLTPRQQRHQRERGQLPVPGDPGAQRPHHERGARARGSRRARPERAPRARERDRGAGRDDNPGATVQQLDRVWEAGGHDRLARRDRLHQHAGGDLIDRVVRQQDDVGGSHELGERRPVPVVAVEAHHRSEPEPAHPVGERDAVTLAVAQHDLRVGLPGDEVARRRPQIGQQRHRLDAPLDALARPEQSPGQHGRLAGAEGGREFRCRPHLGYAVRDDLALARVPQLVRAQPDDAPLVDGGRGERPVQRGGERCQSALGRRVGGDEAITDAHERCLPLVGTAVTARGLTRSLSDRGAACAPGRSSVAQP